MLNPDAPDDAAPGLGGLNQHLIGFSLLRSEGPNGGPLNRDLGDPLLLVYDASHRLWGLEQHLLGGDLLSRALPYSRSEPHLPVLVKFFVVYLS